MTILTLFGIGCRKEQAIVIVKSLIIQWLCDLRGKFVRNRTTADELAKKPDTSLSSLLKNLQKNRTINRPKSPRHSSGSALTG
jgi:hypothetical protein